MAGIDGQQSTVAAIGRGSNVAPAACNRTPGGQPAALRDGFFGCDWILQSDRRQRWSESIVAWFGKYPKDDAAWWGHLWPEDE